MMQAQHDTMVAQHEQMAARLSRMEASVAQRQKELEHNSASAGASSSSRAVAASDFSGINHATPTSASTPALPARRADRPTSVPAPSSIRPPDTLSEVNMGVIRQHLGLEDNDTRWLEIRVSTTIS